MVNDDKLKQEPTIVFGNNSAPLSSYMAYIDERMKWEESVRVYIDGFCEWRIAEGLDKKWAKELKKTCSNFIGFLGMYTDVTDLADVTKAEACGKYIRFLNKGVKPRRNHSGKITYYKYDDSDVLEVFFIYLHKFHNITNTKVLKGLCKKEKLMELG